MSQQRINNLFKTLIVVLSYFIYIKLLFAIFEVLNLGNPYNNWIFSFIADIIYFIFIIWLYRHTFKEDINSLKKELWKKYFLGIKWLVLALILQTIVVGIVRVFIPELIGNEAAISDLHIVYLIFKTMIFSVIVEEIIFKKSIRDVVSNDVIFVIISSLFYGLMNVAYAQLGSTIELLIILPYIVSASIMGILYVRTNNIVLVMLVKFTYNIIPLTATLLGWIK